MKRSGKFKRFIFIPLILFFVGVLLFGIFNAEPIYHNMKAGKGEVLASIFGGGDMWHGYSLIIKGDIVFYSTFDRDTSGTTHEKYYFCKLPDSLHDETTKWQNAPGDIKDPDGRDGFDGSTRLTILKTETVVEYARFRYPNKELGGWKSNMISHVCRDENRLKDIPAEFKNNEYLYFFCTVDKKNIKTRIQSRQGPVKIF